MDSEVTRYLRFSRDIRIVLMTLFGWPGVNPTFGRISARLGQVSNAIAIFGFVNFIRIHSGDVVLITKCISMCISSVTTVIKIEVYLRHPDDLAYLNNYLSATYRKDLSNLKDRPRLLRQVGTFAHFFYTLTIGVSLIFISAEVGAIRAYIKGEYRSVFPMAFPFSYQPGGVIFWSLVGTEFIASYYVWAVASGVDSVFGLYTLELCGELRVLTNRFEDLASGKDYKMKLRECVKRHYMLIKSRDALQNVYGFLSIWIAITSAIVQCSVVFQAKMEVKTMSATNIVFLLFYILMKLMQGYTYAWYGHLIAEESLLCMNAMYNAHWPGSGNLHFMSDVLIVLSQKPMIFRAEGFMCLNMEVFVKIVNAAVSYFFLLETLDNKSDVNK